MGKRGGVKKFLLFFAEAVLSLGLVGCAGSGVTDAASVPEISSEDLEPEAEPAEMCSIRVTAGDEVLQGVLYDNPTARGFVEMLPLTVELWHPAPDFARAFDLPEQIAARGNPGYEYELGSLAYWDSGPSIALIYKASREETVVAVVPVGKITSDVSIFEEYGGVITIEVEEDTESVE